MPLGLTMSSNATPDEQPKKAIAKKIVAPKRLYFFPRSGNVAPSVEATSLTDAQNKVNANTQKAGDE